MENNDISLEIYVKDQKLNKNDYELICSALLENMTKVIVEDVLLNIKEKQFEHNFQGLNGKVDLCIYFDGNTISISSINE